MNPVNSVLITGANAGLGREAARQLAGISSIEKIYLACRSKDKALAAKAALERETKRSIFEIILMDVSDPSSVRGAVAAMKKPVDALLLNAGGMGGRSSNAMTTHGVTSIYAVNVLGHVVLVDEMLERQLITSTVVYAGSEAARGIPKMGVPRPALRSATVDEFRAMADGRTFTESSDPMEAYAGIKLTAALWMSSMARKHPHLRFVTMSPGGTTGTNGMDDLPFLKKLFFKHIGGVLMPMLGMMHGIEDGAKRYVDALLDPKFESGSFYASAGEAAVGKLVDQATLFPTLGDPLVQDNANLAVHQIVTVQAS
ncbi:SDR family NAD(P)-dependent oxidoreductase [Rhodobacteraceae bacterium RKSG542]|uniref:SDR family NAD(P)-dependent oxidoreductase n=1 Tax=Pseudovibrio flavus TaxID=2529854 RepID=UPI0012BD451A|nr:SDR family NAD(P)-dependent oxidoreductase [Pseudovibrio flavus]MTI17098.1 SDR family NAD(P)-dependent oxidoreductase [Pseudovibrio flavus]